MKLVLIVLALCMGIASAVQGATNGALTGRIGLSSAVWLNALVVMIGATLLYFVLPRGAASGAPGVPGVIAPWYLYAGGCYGLFIIAGAAFAFRKLGAGPTTALMVAAQLTTALALDHLGLPSAKIAVTPLRLVGAAMLFTGAVLVLWPKLAGE
jgi:transporter family-2 protein